MRYIVIPRYDDVAEEMAHERGREGLARSMSRRRRAETAESVQGKIRGAIGEEVGGAKARVLSAPTSGSPVTGATIIETEADTAESIQRSLGAEAALVVPDETLDLIRQHRGDPASEPPPGGTAEGWHLSALGLAQARRAGFSGAGKGVTVAVLDTGIAEVAEVRGRIAEGVALDVEGWRAERTPNTDTFNHGTHVAGLIAGRTVGVAPGAKLVNVLLLPNGEGLLSRYILALEWVAARPDIRVINMSAGRRGYSEGMKLITGIMRRLGILVCAAVGNEGPETSRSPGNYRDVFSVGACNQSGQLWAQSGGEQILRDDPPPYDVPKLVAPGESIASCTRDGVFEAWSGTSMATPLVSGMAALLLERFPAISLQQIEEELLSACVSLDLPAARQGRGMLTFPASLRPAGRVEHVGSPTGQGLDKAEAALRRALADASESQVLGVILVVDEATPATAAAARRDPEVQAGGSPQADGRPGELMRELEKLALLPRASGMSPLLAIRGTPNQIRQALALHGVKSAMLDDGYDLIPPVR